MCHRMTAVVGYFRRYNTAAFYIAATKNIVNFIAYFCERYFAHPIKYLFFHGELFYCGDFVRFFGDESKLFLVSFFAIGI